MCGDNVCCFVEVWMDRGRMMVKLKSMIDIIMVLFFEEDYLVCIFGCIVYDLEVVFIEFVVNVWDVGVLLVDLMILLMY